MRLQPTLLERLDVLLRLQVWRAHDSDRDARRANSSRETGGRHDAVRRGYERPVHAWRLSQFSVFSGWGRWL